MTVKQFNQVEAGRLLLDEVVSGAVYCDFGTSGVCSGVGLGIRKAWLEPKAHPKDPKAVEIRIPNPDLDSLEAEMLLVGYVPRAWTYVIHRAMSEGVSFSSYVDFTNLRLGNHHMGLRFRTIRSAHSERIDKNLSGKVDSRLVFREITKPTANRRIILISTN